MQVTFTLLTFTITPSSDANGAISPSSAQTVNYGSNLTFTATPHTGYTVNNWLLDGTVVQTGGTTYTLANITANHTVQVTTTLLTFTVTPSSDANGAISPNTAQTVNYGSNLTFTATPNTGYGVNSWLLDGTVVQTSGTSYTLTNITANHTVQVTTSLVVTLTDSADGYCSPSGGTVTTGNTLDAYWLSAIGSNGYVTLLEFNMTGQIPSGSTIANATLQLYTTSGCATVPVNVFSQTDNSWTSGTANAPTLSNPITSIPWAGNGVTESATITPAVASYFTAGTDIFTVVIAAQTSAGYPTDQFAGQAFFSKENPANQPPQLSIAYNLPLTVTPSAGSNGAISPSTPQSVSSGSSITFTAAPNAGYAVYNWTVDGSPAQTGGTSFTLSNVTVNHNVQVSFSALPTYTITPTTDGNGSISPTTPQTVYSGSSLTFTAAGNANYYVNQWLVDNQVVQTGGYSFTLTNITANHTVQVTFYLSYTILVQGGDAWNTVSPLGPSSASPGSNLTITAMPTCGFVVDAWSVDGTVVQQSGNTLTLTNINANHTVQVSFGQYMMLSTSAPSFTPDRRYLYVIPLRHHEHTQ